jgi:hypothetical protein
MTTAAVVTAVAVVQQAQPASDGVVASPGESMASPAASPGQRLVGRGHVVVSVPEGWVTELGGCYDLPLENRVFFPTDENLSCAGQRPPSTTSVSIYDSTSNAVTGLVSEATIPETLNGLEVLRNPTETAHEIDVSQGWLVVPDEKILIWVDSADPKTIDGILESVARLPEGYVAIPTSDGTWQASRDAMEAAVLTVDVVEEVLDEASPGQLLETRPSTGSVVSTDSIVTLVVAVQGS